MKLRNKIPALLIPLIVVPLLTMGWIAYGELRRSTEQQVFGEMQATLNHLSSRIDTEIKTAVSNIELFAKNTSVRKYVLTSDEDQRYTLMLPPLLRVFQSYQEAFPAYYEIRILTPDGYEDARQANPPIANRSDEEANSAVFQAMRNGRDTTYTSIFRNPDNNQVALFVGKPIIIRDPAVDPINAKPKLRGYLALTTSLQDIGDYIAGKTIGGQGFLFATDAKGRTLFQSKAAPIEERIDSGIFHAMVDGEFRTMPMKVEIGGHLSYIKGAHPHPELYLFAALPEEELIVLRYRLGAVVAVITLIAIVITITFLVAALEYLVVKPIHRLRNASKEIGRGHWDIQSGVVSNDEIGELATAFADMAGNLKNSDEQVRYLAYHDSLTGLPNRAMFKEYLTRAIAHAHRHQIQLALLFLDVDDFKRVNDTLGHQLGDALLQEIAGRLSKHLRQEDYVARPTSEPDRPTEVLARLGGDEFVILLPAIQDPLAPGAVARRLINALSRSLSVGEHECFISASIGITLYPTDGKTADELLKNADLAMYQAKEHGKNSCQYYLDSMNVAAYQRLTLENKLRKAIAEEQLFLHYQPQINARTGEVVGLEALLRWRAPEEGLIPPNVFIPVAEASGLILPIGEWVLQEACSQARAWQKQGHPLVIMSVNVSSVQFNRQDMPKIIQKALDSSGLYPPFLEIEITESTIMSQTDYAERALTAVRNLGVKIALDDFGTAYSSLSYLRRFPIDTLKIDRSFIIDIDKSQECAEIVEAIVAMAHALKLRVVVEGIETNEQLAAVVERNCDVIQGFVFSRPLPAEEIPQLLSQRNLKTA